MSGMLLLLRHGPVPRSNGNEQSGLLFEVGILANDKHILEHLAVYRVSVVLTGLSRN